MHLLSRDRPPLLLVGLASVHPTQRRHRMNAAAQLLSAPTPVGQGLALIYTSFFLLCLAVFAAGALWDSRRKHR